MNNDNQQPEQEKPQLTGEAGFAEIEYVEPPRPPQPTLTNEEIAKRAAEPHKHIPVETEDGKLRCGGCGAYGFMQTEPNTAVEFVAEDTSQLVCQACKPEAGKTISVTAENKCVVCGKECEAKPVIQEQNQGAIRNEKGQFPKGVSGNPAGRPKRDWTWKEVLEDIAQMYVKKKDGTISKKTYKEMVAQRLFSLSIGGNIHAIKEIMNRMDGMPTQTIEAEVDNKGSIVVYKPEKNAE